MFASGPAARIADETAAAAVQRGPGPETAAALCALDSADLTAAGRLDFLRAWEQQAAWASAQVLQSLVAHVGAVAIEDRRGDEVAYLEQAAAVTEARLTLQLSSVAIDDRVDVARQLTSRLPLTFEALRSGQISYAHARAVVDCAAHLSDDLAASCEEITLRRASTRSVADLRRVGRAAADLLDPEAVTRRHQQRRVDRSVIRWREADGMSRMEVTAPAPDIEVIWGALTILSGPGDANDSRKVGARRVDALVRLCVASVAPSPRDETPTPRAGTQAHIVVDLATLLGLAENPGELLGYGPIPAGVARDWLGDATTWRRLVTDPVDGHLLDYGPVVRFAPPKLRNYVQARDRLCIFPSCNQPARQTDVDHHPPWQSDGSGGRTAAAETASLCRRHHRLKTSRTWQLERDGLNFAWTGPSGKTWAVPPRRVLDTIR